MSNYQKEMFEYTINDNLNLSNSNILITGATGYIGSNIVNYLLTKNKSSNSNINIYVYVRNYDKAFSLFSNNVTYLIGNITDEIDSNIKMDYIIHCIDNTNSNNIVKFPVETLENSILGTKSIMRFAKKTEAKSIVYLSSVEVYGTTNTSKPLNENDLGYIDLTSPRSSYPVGKLASENLVNNYFSEYNIPSKIVRLAQVAGPGFNLEDNRFFPFLAKTVVKNEEIVLKTTGKTIKDYLYILDAVEGILTILLKGINGESYNLTNNNNVCSIYEIAEMFSLKYNVKLSLDLTNNNIYPSETKLILSTKKLEELGYKPKASINHIIEQTVNYIK